MRVEAFMAASPRRDATGRNVLVMTGATSGFGRRALERILEERPRWDVLLIARPSERTRALEALPGGAGRLTIVPCDLADLASVGAAARSVLAHTAGRGIDALALNAGVQAVLGDQATVDGLEISFAVNHLAHFLLVERLLPAMVPGGRIVITSSEVHDPEAFCLMGITRAAWEDPAILADPARAQAQYSERVDRGEARYCASKLLNLMHARHLAHAAPQVATVAFNPSVVPGTDIARERNVLQILGWKYLMPVMAPLLPGARTIERSASDLAWLITEADARALTGAYVDGREVKPGSADSRDEAKIARMVEVSRALLAAHESRRAQRTPDEPRAAAE